MQIESLEGSDNNMFVFSRWVERVFLINGVAFVVPRQRIAKSVAIVHFSREESSKKLPSPRYSVPYTTNTLIRYRR